MSIQIAIIDYGVGNLKNVANACKSLGHQVTVTSDVKQIRCADFLILPGVGACDAGMQGLQKEGLDDELNELVTAGKPLLGICLGMQLLATKSYENGEFTTLDFIPGDVKPIPSTNDRNENVHRPNINWLPLNNIEHTSSPVGINKKSNYYFVHSYRFECESKYCIATADHQGIAINAIVKNGNVMGMQFHPEKSGKSGLALLNQTIHCENW